MAIAQINGVPIRYEDSGGDKPVLLFSHGFLMDHTMFDRQVERFSSEAVAAGVAGLILGDEELSAEWVPKWRARRGTSPLREAGATLLGRDDISDRVGEITCPVLVIHGTADQAIPLSEAEAVAAALPDCRGLVTVEGAAHAPNMSHPDIVNDAIASFLASL